MNGKAGSGDGAEGAVRGLEVVRENCVAESKDDADRWRGANEGNGGGSGEEEGGGGEERDEVATKVCLRLG